MALHNVTIVSVYCCRPCICIRVKRLRVSLIFLPILGVSLGLLIIAVPPHLFVKRVFMSVEIVHKLPFPRHLVGICCIAFYVNTFSKLVFYSVMSSMSTCAFSAKDTS